MESILWTVTLIRSHEHTGMQKEVSLKSLVVVNLEECTGQTQGLLLMKRIRLSATDCSKKNLCVKLH